MAVQSRQAAEEAERRAAEAKEVAKRKVSIINQSNDRRDNGRYCVILGVTEVLLPKGR